MMRSRMAHSGISRHALSTWLCGSAFPLPGRSCCTRISHPLKDYDLEVATTSMYLIIVDPVNPRSNFYSSYVTWLAPAHAFEGLIGPGCRRCQCPCGYSYIITYTYMDYH